MYVIRGGIIPGNSGVNDMTIRGAIYLYGSEDGYQKKLKELRETGEKREEGGLKDCLQSPRTTLTRHSKFLEVSMWSGREWADKSSLPLVCEILEL